MKYQRKLEVRSEQREHTSIQGYFQVPMIAMQLATPNVPLSAAAAAPRVSTCTLPQALRQNARGTYARTMAGNTATNNAPCWPTQTEMLDARCT